MPEHPVSFKAFVTCLPSAEAERPSECTVPSCCNLYLGFLFMFDLVGLFASQKWAAFGHMLYNMLEF